MKRPSFSSLSYVSYVSFVFAASLGVAGCSQTSAATVAQFDSMSVDWTSKSAAVAKNLATLQAKLDALPKETVGRSAVDAAVKANQAALATLQADYAKLKTEGTEVFNLGTDLDKSEMIEHAKELTAEVSELGATIDEEKKMLAEAEEKAEKAAKDAEVAGAAAAASSALDTQRTAVLTKIANEGGEADLPELEFMAGGAAFDLSKPGTQKALDALVKFAGACGALRFELVGHTDRSGDAKTNQKLSEDRAAAVKAYLVEHKIDAKSVATSGAGDVRSAVDEPEPASDAERSMDPKKLAAAREKNRRITVRVSKKCG